MRTRPSPAAALLLLISLATTARAAEWHPRGLLDLVLSSGTEARERNTFTQGDSPFDPYRVHLFLDAKLSPTLDAYAQVILHEEGAPIVADGAYAQWTPWLEQDLHVQAGKVPWPIGAWAPHAYSDANPLVGTPLMYQYHTGLAWDAFVPGVDALVSAAGTGQYGAHYAGGTVGAGMPVVDDRWWDVGAVLLGARRPLEFALGVMQGSPGWPVTGADDTPGHTTLGRVGLVPVAGVRVGASGAYGTWMPVWFAYHLPAGRSLRDYHEAIVMADVELARGPLTLRSEGFQKQWQTIATGNLRLHGGYAEVQLALGRGAYVAVRTDALRFADVTTSTGVSRPWDTPVDRLEAGGGYRVSRDVRVKAVFQRNVARPWRATREVTDLFALAASIRL